MKKLKIEKLKVTSFVSSIHEKDQLALLGGADPKSIVNCSYADGCVSRDRGCKITQVSPLC